MRHRPVCFLFSGMLLIVSSAVLTLPGLSAEAPGQPGLPNPSLEYLTGQQYRISTQALVPHGDQIRNDPWPPCNAPANDILSKAAAGLSLGLNANPAIRVMASGLTQQFVSQLETYARSQPGFLAELVSPNRKASCVPLAVVLPAGSTINNVMYWDGDGARGVHPCGLDGNHRMVCGAGYCGWEHLINVGARIGAGSEQLVGAVFKNWSADRARWASFTVDFTPPEGWHP
jgi:hypothetical protein